MSAEAPIGPPGGISDATPGNPLARFARHFLLALQFFTRIPVTGRLAAWVGFSQPMLRRSAAHFPGVGWLVGLVATAVYAALILTLPPSVFAPLIAAVLSTIATVLLTGGFHEDGLADVADGLGGSANRERALEIMKDSRIGAFGAMALVLALLAKVALLALLGDATVTGEDATRVCVLLWLGHVLSRGAPMVLIALLPHVGDAAGSKSKPLADQISRSSLFAGFLWCFIALAGAAIELNASTLIASVVAALLALGVMYRLLLRRLQGFTGDGLGATQQVVEIAFYLGAAFVT
ncbi:MAG: adenosylcobinamide-GDP ribazoletransferase [Pseudomonadota bacterium]